MQSRVQAGNLIWGFETTSSVLKSEKAVHVYIQIMRAFIMMRKMSISNEQLNQNLIAMERKYDKQFQIVFEAIKQLLKEDEKPKRNIGYVKAPESTSDKRNLTIFPQ